jgi:AraC-like DNA-binding protein
MDYREHPAPPLLDAHVQCVWHLRDASPSSAPQTVYPDGRCELILHRAQPMEIQGPDGWRRQARSLFAAQSRRAIRLRATGPLDCVGVRLRPEASAALFAAARDGTALAGWADTVIDLRQLDAPFAEALEGSVAVDDASMARFIDVLAARLPHTPIDARVADAVAALDRACGNLPLRRLAHDVGIGVRSLQARFVAAVGLTVKEYALVQRLQATIRQLDAGDRALAETALDMGFADQAHATRAVRAFAGLTPARLRRALLAQRDGDETLAMAAAFVRGRS